MTELILLILGLALGAAIVAGLWLLRRQATSAEPQITAVIIAERVRAVGKLVGLEVYAKEIATSTKGWGWLPPIILSQAKVAMIFHFEKQYAIDLSRIGSGDLTQLGENHYRLCLPPIEGALRLSDLEPYDIAAGRVLGLLDIIQVNAATQKDLIRRAQEQAADLYERHDEKYRREAQRSIERHIKSLLELFGVTVELVWPRPGEERVEREVEVGGRLREAARI